MRFDPNLYIRRLIESYTNSRGRVGVCLKKLSSQETLELVPASYHEDEQGIECEAIYRHPSGAYLLYARYLDAEQLDIIGQRKLTNRGTEELIRDMLRKELEDLLTPKRAFNDFGYFRNSKFTPNLL